MAMFCSSRFGNRSIPPIESESLIRNRNPHNFTQPIPLLTSSITSTSYSPLNLSSLNGRCFSADSEYFSIYRFCPYSNITEIQNQQIQFILGIYSHLSLNPINNTLIIHFTDGSICNYSNEQRYSTLVKFCCEYLDYINIDLPDIETQDDDEFALIGDPYLGTMIFTSQCTCSLSFITPLVCPFVTETAAITSDILTPSFTTTTTNSITTQSNEPFNRQQNPTN